MILGLDHTGLAVADLDAAGGVYQMLGFHVMDRTPLLKPGPDGAYVPTGADNRVIMFEKGYLELIAITDPALGHVLVPRLERYWGLHIAVLSTSNAIRLHDQLTADGIALSPLTTWTRPIEGGEAGFRFFLYDNVVAPEATLCVVEHLTPDLIRPKGSLAHANGVTGLNGAVFCVTDKQEAMARYRRLLPGVSSADDRLVLGDGTWVRLAERAALEVEFPGAPLPPAPAIAALDYAVADPDRFAELGVPVRRTGERKWLAPTETAGAIIMLTEDASAQRQ